MSIGRICSRVVATASPDESVRAIAERMAEHNVGTVVVVQGQKPVGIVTDRDLAIRVLGAGLNPDTAVDDIMTESVRTLDESTPIEEALTSMKSSGVRRIVVTGEDGALAGIISLDDILELLVEEVESVGAILREESPRMKGGT
ncbi:MAG: CBS domain-containing protein [Longimicrobiales bacterium]